MQERKDLTVPMESKLNERIEQQLGYNDSKAAWIRDAIRQRLEREGIDVTDLGEEAST